MRLLTFMIAGAFFLSSCGNIRQIGEMPNPGNPGSDSFITQSLFNDKTSTISEENIQRILSGTTQKLPQQLKVAIVRLENPQQQRQYWYYRNDEDYLKTQQSYLDLFGQKLKQSSRVIKMAVIPDLLISKTPSFTNIREAAVRLQADAVVVYSITSDLYSKYRFFAKPDIKAFATTQLMILDVRTGLIPFTTIVTMDRLSQKNKAELSNDEAAMRIRNEAVLLTINEIGQQMNDFLDSK